MVEKQSRESFKELNEELKDTMLENLGDPKGKYIDRNALGLKALKKK